MGVILLQNGLYDDHSHFLTATLGWIDASRARGFALRIHASRHVRPEIRAMTGAIPTFDQAPDSQVIQDPAFRGLGNLAELGFSFAAGCRAIRSDSIGPDDLIVLDYAAPGDVFGLSLWLARLPAGRRPRVHCQFHLGDPDWSLDAATGRLVGDTAPHGYAMRRLDAVAGAGRVVHAATTRRLAQVLESVAGRCRESPLTVCVADPATEARLLSENAGSHDVAVVGQLRWERGRALLADVLREFAARRPGRSAAVQVATPEQADALRQAVPDPKALRLTIRVGNLSADDYTRMLLSARIILLPYHAPNYRLRASGVMGEAVAYGRPVVVPDGTWMSEQLAEGLAAAIDRLHALSATAAARRARWRARHSFPAYVDFVLAHGEPARTP